MAVKSESLTVNDVMQVEIIVKLKKLHMQYNWEEIIITGVWSWGRCHAI